MLDTQIHAVLILLASFSSGRFESGGGGTTRRVEHIQMQLKGADRLWARDFEF
jgi:hypothetical protein